MAIHNKNTVTHNTTMATHNKTMATYNIIMATNNMQVLMVTHNKTIQLETRVMAGQNICTNSPQFPTHSSCPYLLQWWIHQQQSWQKLQAWTNCHCVLGPTQCRTSSECCGQKSERLHLHFSIRSIQIKLKPWSHRHLKHVSRDMDSPLNVAGNPLMPDMESCNRTLVSIISVTPLLASWWSSTCELIVCNTENGG